MRNWSVDESKLKQNKAKYRLWYLEQLLSYGLDIGEKINRKTLIANWKKISARLDPRRLETIKFFLWS